MPQNTRRILKLGLIVLISLFTLAALLIAFLPVLVRLNFVDFSNYSTLEEVQQAISGRFELNATTKTQVEEYLQEQGIMRGCIVHAELIWCKTVSPMHYYESNTGNALMDWINEAVTLYTYEFTFHFEDDILQEIEFSEGSITS